MKLETFIHKFITKEKSQKNDKNHANHKSGLARLLTNFMTIRAKIIVSYMLPVIFIIILGFVSFQKTSYGIKTNYETSTGNTIDMTSEYLRFGLENVSAVTLQYSIDSSINKYFRNYYSDDLIENNIQYNFISNLFTSKILSDKFIKNIYCISDTVKSVTTINKLEDGTYTEFVNTDAGKYIMENPNKGVWMGSNDFLDEHLGNGPDTYSLRYVKKVMEADAILVVDVDPEAIKEILGSLKIDKTGLVGIVTEDGKELTDYDITDTLFVDQSFYKEAQAGEKTADFEYVSYHGKKYLFLYSKIGETGAMVCSLIPNTTINSQADSIKQVTIYIVVIACLVAVLATFWITTVIDKTVKEIIKKLKKAAQGDLTVDFSTKRRDEFRILIEEIENTFNNMKQLIQQVMLMSHNVSDSSVFVAKTSDVFYTSSGNITKVMSEVEKGVVQQAEDAENCLLHMDNLSNKIIQIGDKTKEIGHIITSAKQSVESGTVVTYDLNNQTKSTKEITSNIINEIENLEKKSLTINSIINVINDIANQTNLLSLNASIEAARAGDFGRGFAVVAEEIRHLADQSKESVNNIKNIIKNIQQDTKKTVLATKEVESVIALQEKAVINTTDSFQNINNSVEHLVLCLEDVIKNIDNIETERINTLGGIENISAVLEEIAASTNNVSQQSMDQLLSVELLNKSASDLNNNSNAMVGAIQKFKIE